MRHNGPLCDIFATYLATLKPRMAPMCCFALSVIFYNCRDGVETIHPMGIISSKIHVPSCAEWHG